MSSADSFLDQVPALIKERGMSMTRMATIAAAQAETGVSVSLVQKVMRGERYPTPPIMRAVAKALGVRPERFPEYRLAKARAQLDEREVGLRRALKRLEG